MGETRGCECRGEMVKAQTKGAFQAVAFRGERIHGFSIGELLFGLAQHERMQESQVRGSVVDSDLLCLGGGMFRLLSVTLSEKHPSAAPAFNARVTSAALPVCCGSV